MAEINQRKAGKLYDAIDGSDFYANPVDPVCRSWMNVPFTLADRRWMASSWPAPSAAGLRRSRAIARSAACARASTTRCRRPGVDALIDFMAEFERTNG
jgi:phosphoserine aminotransferase